MLYIIYYLIAFPRISVMVETKPQADSVYCYYMDRTDVKNVRMDSLPCVVFKNNDSDEFEIKDDNFKK